MSSSSLCQDHLSTVQEKGLSQFKPLTLVFQTKKSQTLELLNIA